MLEDLKTNNSMEKMSKEFTEKKSSKTERLSMKKCDAV